MRLVGSGRRAAEINKLLASGWPSGGRRASVGFFLVVGFWGSPWRQSSVVGPAWLSCISPALDLQPNNATILEVQQAEIYMYILQLICKYYTSVSNIISASSVVYLHDQLECWVPVVSRPNELVIFPIRLVLVDLPAVEHTCENTEHTIVSRSLMSRDETRRVKIITHKNHPATSSPRMMV